jgi:hypothetical protein
MRPHLDPPLRGEEKLESTLRGEEDNIRVKAIGPSIF